MTANPTRLTGKLLPDKTDWDTVDDISSVAPEPLGLSVGQPVTAVVKASSLFLAATD